VGVRRSAAARPLLSGGATTMRFPTLAFALASVALLIPACATSDADVEDGENDSFLGKNDAPAEGSDEAKGVLALVNDLTVDFAELDVDAGLSSRVARNLITRRDGADATPGTADDNLYDTLAEVDAVPYVGAATLEQLVAYARSKGLVGSRPRIDVIFSPQPAASSHTARVAEMIRGAQHSIDIAMYSYSDAGVGAALQDAINRGIDIRFLFDTASEDRKIADLTARTNTKSGKLEKIGVDVRWVNKILHHKFILVDGPRDDAARATTGRLVTGSANWSSGGAGIYDENTLFIDNSAELNNLYQKEFDYLWTHSRDFALASPIPQLQSTATLGPAADDAGIAAMFTSANFNVSGDTFSLNWQNTKVNDALVAAIGQATTSIHIAQGHMRLRGIAEALIAAKQARPSLDIKIHLDQQEFISTSGHQTQVTQVSACLALAGADPRKQFDCKSKDFLFSKMLIDAGIDVRFKCFSYRWDASYAVQMHSKYIIIDGDELWTGSYNLSMNAEQATMENIVRLGAEYGDVIAKYEANFQQMRELGRSTGALAALRQTISTASSIPLVFAPLSLTFQEFTDLKSLIRTNCPLADSTEYRTNPGAHRFCPR
jgi:phosphatidylserine/phosphatidylglycerophosphate/cardiolipin synthase-like enzyme